jgi:transcriptional regulator with XRE-family HTH domain
MTTEPQASTGQQGGIPADSFANRLMLARAFAGHLSIRDAAELCDLGRGAWTNWEKGAKPADIIDIATVVAEKLRVDFDWLLFGGELSQAEGRPIRRRITRSPGGGTPNSRSTQVIRPVSPVAGYGPFGQKPAGSTRPGSPKRRPALIGPGRRAM